jgi:small subunit ribosomal protein S4
VISVREGARSRSLAARSLELMQITPVPDWLTLDRDNVKGTVNRVPSREDINPIVNEQLIVELYSR